MNISKYIILGGIVSLTALSACSERLELKPEQSIENTQAFANESNATASLLGVYSIAQYIDVFGSMPQIIQDYMADNTDFVGSFPTLQDINNYVTTAPNASVSGWWRHHYNLINAANSVIEKVPGVTDSRLTEASKKQYVAEAKFMRAVTYFSLINTFAQPFSLNNGASDGVPLVLTAFNGTIDLPARAKVADVYAQIKKDLMEAEADLPAAITPNSRGRATKGAVWGYLSRMALYRGDYQEAATYAKRVIDSNLYVVAPNYSFYGATPTTEHVFAIVNSNVDNGRTGSGGWASYHRPANQGGRGDAPATTDFVTAVNAQKGDLRASLLDVVRSADGANKPMTLKFRDAVNNTDLVHMMRTSEMYLTRAEALAELNGVNQESIDLVNPIRKRAGLTDWKVSDFASKQALVDAILRERRLELAFEGHRRNDLLRRKMDLRKTGPTAAAAKFGADKTIMPIPQSEIDINKNLKQNPGY